METLDHEKFQGAKELAEISVKIAEGTAALATLKESETAYLGEREEKLTLRLKQALVDSADLIKAIGDNHSALVGYKTELIDFHQYVLSLIQNVMDWTDQVNKESVELESRMSIHEKEVTAFREASQREWVKIKGERSAMGAERDEVGKKMRLLEDRKAMFERTVARTAPTKN